jgi:hypothetical protein
MSQTVKFDVWAWKDIMRVCGSALPGTDREYPRVIRIICKENHFKAYGNNGYMVTVIEGDCAMKDGTPVDILIPPQKTPAKTKVVELNPCVNADGESRVSVHVLYFYDADNRVTGSWDVLISDGKYPDLENRVIKPVMEEINRWNHGIGHYAIGVNPRNLLAALEGMKDRESVILNFASPNQGFLIRPLDGEQNVMSVVLPVRLR